MQKNDEESMILYVIFLWEESWYGCCWYLANDDLAFCTATEHRSFLWATVL